ncbi:MAG: TonB-dependent receptor [Bryobacterales bacterium]|nr:TonB-dependent receptor [Bryobacterales bacterium]
MPSHFPLFWLAAAVPLIAAPLRIQVVDAHSAAVPGALVELRETGADGRVWRRTTGMDGVVEAPAAPPVLVRVQAPGFENFQRRFETPPVEPVRLATALLRTSIDVVVRDTPLPAEAAGTAMEIEKTGARTVFDAVEKLVPGAFVSRRGVMGYGIATNGTGMVSIRGIGEQPNAGVLIVVDGRPDVQGLMGHPLPDFYSLSDAGTVTVTQGPASVLYGSNAMGGVIEVKPARPQAGAGTRLSSGLGSFLTGQHRFSHGARLERGFYSLAAGISHTRGDRTSSAFRNQDGILALGRDLSSSWKASVEGRYGHFHVEDPGPVSAPLHNSYARVGRGGLTVNLDNAGTRTWGYARLYAARGHHILTDGFRSTDSTTGVRVDQQVLLTPQVNLEVGSDVAVYGGRARNVQTRLDYGRHDLTGAAGFSRINWTPRSRLHLRSGVRYEHNSVFGSIGVPEFGVTYSPVDGYSLALEAARGFRNPTLRELYLFPAPNPLLRPEHLWNYQAAFLARPARALSLSATVFYANLSSLIVTTGRFPNLALNNSGRALNRGWENTVRWKAHRRVALESGYAYVRSTNLTPYVPSHKWNYSVEFDAGRAYVQAGGMTVGKRWADARHSATMPGFTLATLRATLPVSKTVNLFLMLDNLFNRRYEVVPGYPMLGINLMSGFTLSF